MLSKIKRTLIQYGHILFIILVFIGISYTYLIYAPNTFKKILMHNKYTIATVKSDWHHRNSKGFGYDYVYFVNGKRYRKTVNINSSKGSKHLLTYDSLNPNHQKILDFYPINYDITPPTNGWKYEEVPFPIDSVEIRKYMKNNK